MKDAKKRKGFAFEVEALDYGYIRTAREEDESTKVATESPLDILTSFCSFLGACLPDGYDDGASEKQSADENVYPLLADLIHYVTDQTQHGIPFRDAVCEYIRIHDMFPGSPDACLYARLGYKGFDLGEGDPNASGSA